MKLTENQMRILKSINQASRTLRTLTNGALVYHALSPVVVEKYINVMLEGGYITQDRDRFFITELGRQTVSKTENLAAARSIATKGTYRTMDGEVPFHMRPGSDHSHIKSRGLSC